MSKSPLISVCMPAYNHEKYIQETIQSVIDQTYQDIELLIIDDGSTDSTLKKIKEMETKCQKRFIRFLYKKQENQGICGTLNNLIKLSKGEYITLIASDDKYTPNALSDMIKEFKKDTKLALVVGKNYIMDNNSQPCYWNKNQENVYDKSRAKWLSFSDFLIEKTKVDFFGPEFGTYEKLVKTNHIVNGYLIRRSIFEKTGGYRKEAPLDDHWIMLQLSKYGKMKYIDIPTLYYRWHSNNTVKQRKKMNELAKKTFKFEYEQLIKNNQQDYLKLFLLPKQTIILKTPFISIIKEKNVFFKTKVLILFGKRFVLCKKAVN